MIFILSAYLFKFAVALIDTVPFYYGVKYFSNYLEIDPNKGYDGDQSEEIDTEEADEDDSPDQGG